MTSALIEMMQRDTGCPRVDGAALDDFLRPGGATALFIAGWHAKRPETGDVAVIFREMLLDFGTDLRGALVAKEAEPMVQQRFKAPVVPCVVILRDGEPVARLSGIRDWSDYVGAVRTAMGAPDPVRH